MKRILGENTMEIRTTDGYLWIGISRWGETTPHVGVLDTTRDLLLLRDQLSRLLVSRKRAQSRKKMARAR